ncbi:zinc-binding dehydrogenase [Paenibacillus sp. GCM10023252]|uniref:zinc-binding dehydrogenase n=1 Tax=Paenibacillus sp. GCM10023252 TaxID=3252649 RepID=UPI00361DCA25
MPLYEQKMINGFTLPQCEKHFHDHDETWLIIGGQGTGYYIDHSGIRADFNLQAGDAWLIPAGYEHGSDGPNSADFIISVFNGTMPAGAHKPGHYYVEEEGYVPQLELRKVPSERYRKRVELPHGMRGVVFEAIGSPRFRTDLPVPACGDDQILIRTMYSGITNGTERNVLIGGNYGGRFPLSYGYQNVGEVVMIGEKTNTKLRIGDLVFSGQGGQGHREYIAVSGSNDGDSSSLIVKLPERLEPQDAAMFGMASVAVNNVRRSGAGLGCHVLVVGLGPIGQFTAQAARAAGARVTTCDLVESRLALSLELGADEAINTGTEEGWERLKEAGPFDIVFEDSGAPVLDRLIGEGWAGGLVRMHGTVVMVAGRKEVNYNFNAAQAKQLNVLHVGHFDRIDLLTLTDLVAKGTIQTAPVIQDKVSIEEAEEQYIRLRDRSHEMMGVVFTW